MKHRRLSDILTRLRKVQASSGLRFTGDLLRDSRNLAVVAFGDKWREDIKLTDLVALYLQMNRLAVYRPDTFAIEQVHHTDIKTLPTEPPSLLQKAFLIEARDLGQDRLFKDVVCLGGYRLCDHWYLVVLRFPDTVCVYPWAPIWEKAEPISTGLLTCAEWDRINAKLYPTSEEYALAAAQFAVALGLLLDAEGSPLHVEEHGGDRLPRRRHGKKPSHSSDWTVRTITVPRGRRTASQGHVSVSFPKRSSGASSGIEGRNSTSMQVRGHFKQQAYGVARSKRRLIYVEAYQSTRYTSDRPLRINVRGRKERAA